MTMTMRHSEMISCSCCDDVNDAKDAIGGNDAEDVML
jgi:hypothetical protein